MFRSPCLSFNTTVSHKMAKIKCTLVQALRLCTGHTAHRGSRAIALPFLDYGTTRGWGVSVTPWPLFTPWKDPVFIVQEAGWAPGPVWTGAENLAPTGIPSPDCPARSQSLYQLRFPAHTQNGITENLLENLAWPLWCIILSCQHWRTKWWKDFIIIHSHICELRWFGYVGAQLNRNYMPCEQYKNTWSQVGKTLLHCHCHVWKATWMCL